MELLKRQYRSDERPCKRSAEEVVDMERRCSKEHWADCLYAGSMYARGCGVAESRAPAAELYRRACSFGSMLGCTMYAWFEQDQGTALTLLEAPCARGHAPACAYLGRLLLERGREAEVPRAARLLKVACHDDDPGYCSEWGKLVMRWKLEPEFQDAQRHLERACRSEQPESCQIVASAYDQGLLGVTDPERALAIYRFSCGHHYLPSCDALGHLLLERGLEEDQEETAEAEGVDMLYDACIAGYGPSCNRLGQAEEEGRWGAPADLAKALQYYEYACALGHPPACQRVSELGAKK
jgi:TPR repeat protein